MILDLFQSKLEKKVPEDILENLCFQKDIDLKNKKIHLRSLLLEERQGEYNFPGKKLKEIVPYLNDLNTVFEDYLHFEGNGNPLVTVTRVWQEKPTQALWYLG